MNKRMIAPLLFGLVGVAILLSLGFWQLQRLEWKRGKLAEIAAKIQAEPGGLPAEVIPERDRYRPVALSGRTGDKELHVLVSRKDFGAGYRVVALLQRR